MKNTIYEFLKKDYKNFYNLSKEIDECLFTSPHSAIIKGRLFIENITKEIAVLENYEYLNTETLSARLRKLVLEDIIGSEINKEFNIIRQIGNEAAHNEIDGDLELALRVHKNLYKIIGWFVINYVKDVPHDFEPEPYKSPTPTIHSSTDYLVSESIINELKEVKELLANTESRSNSVTEVAIDSVDEKEIEPSNVIKKECLIDEISRLKESSKEAVEGLNNFSEFKKYMHITRDAQEELENIILKAHDKSNAQLILVCGSVGDGKSHIISYFKQTYPKEMAKFKLHNDATESLEPKKTSMDTLNEVLDSFSDERIDISSEKLILAINLGTLNNFIDSKYGERFRKLKKFVTDKRILETSIEENTFDELGNIQFVNFSDYHLFTLEDGKVKSKYIKSLIKKITDPSELNIFYKSYKKNCSKCMNATKCPIKANYELLSEESVQEVIVDLLVECIIKKKIIISTRALLNFMYDLIVSRIYDVNSPDFKSKINRLKKVDYIKSLTPNIIFDHKELSFIFEALNSLDPLNIRNEEVDDFLIKFNNTVDISRYFYEYIDYPKGYLDEVLQVDFNDSEGRKISVDLLKLFIRSYYLCGKGDLFSLKDDIYQKFISYLYYWNKGNKSKLQGLYSEIKDGILKWNGQADKNHINIFLGKNQIQYKVSEELELKADLTNLPNEQNDELIKFLTSMQLKYKSEKLDKSATVEIDFSLYELLIKVTRGYRPNKKDKNHFIKFIEFINKLESAGSQQEKLIFTEKNRQSNKRFRLEYDDEFEIYKFVEI